MLMRVMTTIATAIVVAVVDIVVEAVVVAVTDIGSSSVGLGALGPDRRVRRQERKVQIPILRRELVQWVRWDDRASWHQSCGGADHNGSVHEALGRRIMRTLVSVLVSVYDRGFERSFAGSNNPLFGSCPSALARQLHRCRPGRRGGYVAANVHVKA